MHVMSVDHKSMLFSVNFTGEGKSYTYYMCVNKHWEQNVSYVVDIRSYEHLSTQNLQHTER